MTREEFYKLTDILNTEVLGNFMHGGEADELIAMFEEAVEHSNILEQEEPVSDELEEAASMYAKEEYSHKSPATLPDRCKGCYAPLMYTFKAGAQWQKQKDALTWEDIPKILSICENLKTSWWFRDNEQTKQIGKQPFWEEVLKRFKENKL